ncbi:MULTISPECIES: glycoside hydrolase family 32 protein [unclassified Rhizobium]|uniref:glycoside hydrolase family 32 protein n=1 Tax=unclassified Rhizobium TaxID=2613769 RepID=UPI0006F8B9E7|nr:MULTISPECIES: glycoside hydrolase family 32 protein [unclassified Rhizobium]KQV33580.1 beta-fructofuranosidase [Rhizobium sp. Root1212]KRD23124.1 beta-fructofuranosidase [Rhizobium sp. Root268]
MSLQAKSVNQQLETIQAELPAGTVLHLWLKARTAGGQAKLSIAVDGGDAGEPSTRRSAEFEFFAVTLAKGGSATLSYDAATTSLSVAYAFRPETVMEEGIRLLHSDARTAAPEVPDSYHFRPPFGWMNDPNGFGRFGGNAHLFYQHYPHELRWNTMHWGHAVSKDFLRWTHLPMFLFPADHLSEDDDGRGGAFSGSAIAVGEDIRVFYTEHVRDRQPEEQIQLSAVSRDGIVAGPSETVLPLRPEGLDLTTDFRDPYVFKGPDGRWKMLLGSRDKTGGVVLLYETAAADGADGWTFLGIIHREDGFGMTAAECPCMVPLTARNGETRWALIFGLLTSRDPATGRRNLTSVIVGRFDGRTFTAEFEQELDFGSDAYAFQAFVDGDEPVGIAWLANWTDFTKKDDFPTAMTLPRRVLLEGDTVLTPPVAAAESLRHQLLDDTALAAGKTVPLGTGAVEIVLDLTAPGAAFELAFDHPDVDLGVKLDGDGLAIVFDARTGKTPPRYIAAGAKPSSLRIFLDAGSIEVFADNGRWAGSKRIPGFAAARSATLTGTVAKASVWQLKL